AAAGYAPKRRPKKRRLGLHTALTSLRCKPHFIIASRSALHAAMGIAPLFRRTSPVAFCARMPATSLSILSRRTKARSARIITSVGNDLNASRQSKSRAARSRHAAPPIGAHPRRRRQRQDARPDHANRLAARHGTSLAAVDTRRHL